MQKTWWFKKEKKEISKKKLTFSIWKGSFLLIIGISFLSFFSVINKSVYADKKQLLKEFIHQYNLQTLSNLWFPSYIAKIINDYTNWKNILKKDKNEIDMLQNKLWLFIQILWYWKYKQKIINLINIFSPYKKDIFRILWENKQKNYLIIFENTSEERADGWFIGSFMKVSFSWWHLVDYKIYDSYKVFYSICKKQNPELTWTNVFKKCDETAWSLKDPYKPYNRIFKTTTFINSNIFWFTNLNWQNVINQFKKAYKIKIDWVIFIKSGILKYLFLNWEKLLWNLEIINYKNLVKYKKWEKILQVKNKNIGWWKWIKAEYLEKVNNLLEDKKQILKNFITNFKKITKNWLIQLYLPESSKKFQNFLRQENLNFYQQNWYWYIFFYNLWFNKTSKFIDKIITVNNTTYVNPTKFKLYNWLNIIKYIYVLNTDPEYYKYLKKNNVPKTSYLWSKKIIYKNVLIVPKQCKITDETKDTYLVMCNFK